LLQANGTGAQTLDGLPCLQTTPYLDSQKPFELFTQYLYTGRIDEVPSKNSVKAPRYNLFDYVRVWVLCDQNHFQIPPLQDLALKRIEQYYQEHAVKFNFQQVKYIYSTTVRGSELRKNIAEEAVHEFMKVDSMYTASHISGEYSYEYSSENAEFASDMLHAAKRGAAKGWLHPFMMDTAKVTPPNSPPVSPSQGSMGSPPELSYEPSPLRGTLLDPTTPKPPPHNLDPILIPSESHSALQSAIDHGTPTPKPKKLFGEVNQDGSITGIPAIVEESLAVMKKAITI
jgi:hypothetical protein